MKRRTFLKWVASLAVAPALTSMIPTAPAPAGNEWTFDYDDDITFDHVDTYMGLQRNRVPDSHMIASKD